LKAYSHAEGYGTAAMGYGSHAEGYGKFIAITLIPTDTEKVYTCSGMTPSVGDVIYLKEKANY